MYTVQQIIQDTRQRQMMARFWDIVGHPPLDLPDELRIPLPVTEAELWAVVKAEPLQHTFEIPGGAP